MKDGADSRIQLLPDDEQAAGLAHELACGLAAAQKGGRVAPGGDLVQRTDHSERIPGEIGIKKAPRPEPGGVNTEGKHSNSLRLFYHE